MDRRFQFGRARAIQSASIVVIVVALASAACGQSSGIDASPDGGAQSGNSSGSPGGTSDASDSNGERASAPANEGAPAAASDSGSTQGTISDAGTTAETTAGTTAETTPGTTPDASTQTSTDSGPTVVTCPSTVLQAGDSNESLMSGGMMRTYVLHVPTGYTGQAAIPVVVDYHGLGSTSSGEEAVSSYGTLGDTEGYATVFPQGIDDAWNIGPCCTTSRTVDDLTFSRDLVKDVQTKICVDPKRVYAVGYSMGGGMSHYLACNAADLFAAVAPAAFDLLIDSEEPCNPSRPITEISFRGTADPIVPYDGGASMPPNGLQVTIHFLGAEGTFQKWAQLDGCTGSPSAPDSNGCSTYSQCKDGVEVTLCTNQGGSHDPGNAQIGWPMLKAHPMP